MNDLHGLSTSTALCNRKTRLVQITREAQEQQQEDIACTWQTDWVFHGAIRDEKADATDRAKNKMLMYSATRLCDPG